MTDLPLHEVASTPTTITLGWTPVPCVGYVLYVEGRRTSNSWDPGKNSWKIAKIPGPTGLADPHARIVALGAEAEGLWPPPSPPAVKYGVNLPARLPAYFGPLPEAPTLATLRSLITSGNGVKTTAPIDLGGQDLVLNVKGTATNPVTVDLAAPVSNGRVLISRASYLCLRFTDLGHSPIDGIKLTDGSHHIDIDGRGGNIHDTARQGFLQTGTDCHSWQFWNAREVNCGSAVNTNKDHANYVHDARMVNGVPCVMGNIIVTAPYNYGFQFYSDCRDLIATGVESHGSRNGRGGIICGNEPTDVRTSTERVQVIGPIVSSAAHAMEKFGNPVQCRVYDGVAINSGGFDTAFQPVNCITATTPTAAKGHVDAARYPLLPSTRIDGQPQNGGAGCS